MVPGRGGNDDGVTSEHSDRGNTYDAAAGWVLPELRDLVPDGGRAEQLTVRSDSVYFDTEQHDLLRHGGDVAVSHRSSRRRRVAAHGAGR